MVMFYSPQNKRTVYFDPQENQPPPDEGFAVLDGVDAAGDVSGIGTADGGV